MKADALEAYGISIAQVSQALQAQNLSVPGGSTTEAGQNWTIRTNAYFQTADEMKKAVIVSRPGGLPITLDQIADVQQSYAPVNQQTLLNGRDAVVLGVTAQSGANVVQVDDAVKVSLARPSRQIPPGMRIDIVNDSTVYTGKSPMQAALEGRIEIGLAAVAITLTDIVVYGPVAFTQGLIGQIFREFGLTIVTATIFSLFVSFTVTPLLASRWLRANDDDEHLATVVGGNLWTRFAAAWERGYARLRRFHGRVIHGALRRRPLVLLVALAALLQIRVKSRLIWFRWVSGFPLTITWGRCAHWGVSIPTR